MAGMGIVLAMIVQATKELGCVKRIPTLLYAWGLAIILLFIGTTLRDWPIAGGPAWAQVAYLSVINGVLVAAVAVLGHQVALRAGLLKEADSQTQK